MIEKYQSVTFFMLLLLTCLFSINLVCIFYLSRQASDSLPILLR